MPPIFKSWFIFFSISSPNYETSCATKGNLNIPTVTKGNLNISTVTTEKYHKMTFINMATKIWNNT